MLETQFFVAATFKRHALVLPRVAARHFGVTSRRLLLKVLRKFFKFLCLYNSYLSSLSIIRHPSFIETIC